MFGKREQIVALSIGVLATIFIVHILLFDPRAKRYGEVLGRFTEGSQALSGAKMPAGARVIPDFSRRTGELQGQVTSVVTELSLDVPDYYKTMDVANLVKRYQVIKDLLKELVELRQSVKTPVLTFLDDRRNPLDPRFPEGWNFPRELPRATAQVALVDTLRKAIDRYKIMQTVPDPNSQLLARQEYNLLMDQIGASPMQLSNFIGTAPGGIPVFFNDPKMAEKLPGGAAVLTGAGGGPGAQQTAGSVIANPFSINRFGPFVPDLKRLWMVSLIQSRLTATDNLDVGQLNELFEISLIFDDTLLYVERQLRALIDIIKIAERHRVSEISRVNLLKPVDLAASRKRGEAAATPAPGAPAAPAAGAVGSFLGNRFAGAPSGGATANVVPTVAPDTRVGVGTGIEFFIRGSNSATVDFLFEVGTSRRTYAIDDLYITARPNNEIETSTTIELVTKLEAK
jgi:hypothetical protein